MKTVGFFLSMPKRGSWNGGWSGEGRLYAKVERLADAKAEEILAGSPYTHRWDDGWTARIDVRLLGGKESREVRRKTVGFSGYDWMVASIRQHGDIRIENQV